MRSRTPAIGREAVQRPTTMCRKPGRSTRASFCRKMRFRSLGARREGGMYQLELLKHYSGKTFRDGHPIHARPIAINMIAANAVYDHHRSARTHTNALAELKRSGGLAWHRRWGRVGKGRSRQRHAECDSERQCRCDRTSVCQSGHCLTRSLMRTDMGSHSDHATKLDFRNSCSMYQPRMSKERIRNCKSVFN